MDLLFRVACHGGADEPLNVHLKRITDSAYTRKTLGGADIDGEFIAPVIQESHDGDCRREIMRHLRQCLSEPSGKRWQRIYGGLALTEKLMQHGSYDLVVELAHGHHFDLVQKVSFLEYFDAEARGCTDRRAQNVVRTKAKELLMALVPLLQKASLQELPSNAGLNHGKDTMSVCSKDTRETRSTAASSNVSSSHSSVSSTSPTSSVPEPIEAPKIDEAFNDLRAWMDSSDHSGGSGSVSPRSSGEPDWEPIGVKSPHNGPRRECSEAADTFFTPMPAPATSRSKFMMSL